MEFWFEALREKESESDFDWLKGSENELRYGTRVARELE
jgi:hypothetical protein